MGHLFSRAIKRLTFGGGATSSSSTGSSNSASRNQLPDNEQQETRGGGQPSSQRESDQLTSRPTVQAIPVGQSIDSAEYAAFENASSALPSRVEHEQTIKQRIPTPTPPPPATSQQEAAIANEDDEENALDEATADGSADQNKQPEVEEAVIKIQALVRGHLTRKALKDAQQQAASVAPNALGQRQFDEESLIKNPPSAIFLPTSPLSSNLPNQEAFNNLQQQQQQQQSNKHANSRVPPLESIAEDEVDETAANTDPNQETSSALPSQTATISEEGQRRRLSSARKQSAGNAAAAATTTSNRSSNDEAPATPSSPQPPSTANASIDIHCDTPASSVSIDIVDHISRPMGFGLASVLHPHHSTTVSEQPNSQMGEQVTGNIATSDGELQRAADDEVNILPDISGIPSNRVSAAAAGAVFENNTLATASSLPASPPHINLAATINSHSIDSAEAAAIRIQSAFRGYHTRKHSPYRRRRSPVNGSNGVAAAAAAGPQTNGYGHTNGSDHVRGRNLLLRQQDATAMEEEEEEEEDVDELDGEEDEGVEGGRLMAEDLANTLLADEDEEDGELDEGDQDQRRVLGELESDDIERRDPSGRVGEQDVSLKIETESLDHEPHEPALVSSSSFEDDQRQQEQQPPPLQNNERLEVVSPDEAIGSGRSSPALASDNSSDEEHGSGGGGDSPQLLDEGGSQQQQQQQGGSGGNKNKKRNRNKRKGGKK